ncbi:uncharacterized protein LOC123988317 [Osmia bicornis bicornis]|uniref:uncharacterized protein LOC123988317 n=1 Tax=Osmia bicornis bicornis TaxID=1437191 RepID=UPI001EAEF18B|nr:uncharacterized protein LOC123988317 [Osmia bicornis bicornis]
MASMENSCHIEKLSNNNYESSVLISNNLWTYVNGSNVKNEQNEVEWTSKDEKALALIILSTKENQLNHIKRAKTSKQASTAKGSSVRTIIPDEEETITKNGETRGRFREPDREIRRGRGI